MSGKCEIQISSLGILRTLIVDNKKSKKQKAKQELDLAALNLSIDPQIILTQGVIFLANIYIVKNWMVAPYLQLKEKRYAQTLGRANQTQQQSQDIALKQKTYSERLQAALQEAKVKREQLRAAAVKENETRINTAKAAAEKTVEQMRLEIKSMLEEEKRKVPELVQQLSTQVFQSAVGN
jgi:F0F1-type ATP synthase membrane subunit b/b'